MERFLPTEAVVFLVNVAWQSAVVLAVALVAERFARRQATVRHSILLAGLLAALCLVGTTDANGEFSFHVPSPPLCDVGGQAGLCHLAILLREAQVPAVIAPPPTTAARGHIAVIDNGVFHLTVGAA